MSDIESAIADLEYSRDMYTYLSPSTTDLAIQALQEKADREKLCDGCKKLPNKRQSIMLDGKCTRCARHFRDCYEPKEAIDGM